MVKEGNDALRQMMESVSYTMQSYKDGNNILTDDKAPVELLGMKQIDLIIKDEVSYYKEIYKTYGIKGLIENL